MAELSVKDFLFVCCLEHSNKGGSRMCGSAKRNNHFAGWPWSPQQFSTINFLQVISRCQSGDHSSPETETENTFCSTRRLTLLMPAPRGRRWWERVSTLGQFIFPALTNLQGTHRVWKTWKFELTFSSQGNGHFGDSGKVRENEQSDKKSTSTTAKISCETWETFGLVWVLITDCK